MHFPIDNDKQSLKGNKETYVENPELHQVCVALKRKSLLSPLLSKLSSTSVYRGR